MEGQVFVPYTDIGGYNMESRMMGLSINGSSEDSSNAVNPTFSVAWVLPGGITNKKNMGDYQGGEWGYLLDTKTNHPLPYTDEEVIFWLKNDHSIAINDDGTLVNSGDESKVEGLINDKLYEYVNRALQGLGDSSWDNFRNYFGLNTCVYFVGG